MLRKNKEIKLSDDDSLHIAYSKLKARVQKVLKHHDFYHVNLKKMFGRN